MQSRILKKLLLFFSCFFAYPVILISGASLKLVKEIGDSDGVIIHRPNGVVITKEKEIFVADSKQHYLAKFDWNGRLIKKIGQLGQGPADFYLPMQLQLLENRLFLFDSGNNRFVEIGTDLENPVYHKYPDAMSLLLLGNFTVLEKHKFVFFSCPPNDSGTYQAIRILDISSNRMKVFFDQLPQEVTVPEKKVASSPRLRFHYCPVFGTDHKNRRFIISFHAPGNPIEFFIYSFDGKSLDNFSYVYEKNYRVPDFYRDGKRPPKDLKYTQIQIPGIFVYKGHYVVFVSKVVFKGRKGAYPNVQYLIDTTDECLIFDQKTKKLKSRFPAPNDPEIFTLNEAGLLSLFGHDKDDNPVVQIYKLEL